MRLVSWNVNGLRSALQKGFLQWLKKSDVDLIGLQEVRARHDQLPDHVVKIDSYLAYFNAAERPGYSGVALYTRRPPERVITSIGESLFDVEGRVQIAEFATFTLANIYFPNGSGKNRDNSRIPFKLAFYRRLFDTLDEKKCGQKPIFVIGDFNTAHREIDLARPKANQKTSGFCLEEREELDRWLKNGWVDTFRHFEQGSGHYSWWSNRPGVREKNVGWRIDYVLANEAAMKHVTNVFIWPHVMGSDHCPVGVDVSL